MRRNASANAGMRPEKLPKTLAEQQRSRHAAPETTDHGMLFYESMIFSKKMKSFSKKCLTILLHLV